MTDSDVQCGKCALDRVAALREQLQVLATTSNRDTRAFLCGLVDDELQLLESMLAGELVPR
jgi:hypothetical protein